MARVERNQSSDDLLEKEQGILRDTDALREGVLTGSVPMKGLPPRATSLGDTQALLGAFKGEKLSVEEKLNDGR